MIETPPLVAQRFNLCSTDTTAIRADEKRRRRRRIYHNFGEASPPLLRILGLNQMPVFLGLLGTLMCICALANNFDSVAENVQVWTEFLRTPGLIDLSFNNNNLIDIFHNTIDIAFFF